MSRRRTNRFVSIAALAGLMALGAAPAASAAGHHADRGDIVVANRGSANLSVIDAATLEVTTVDLPTSAPAEPMYVNQYDRGGVVFVGDRANDQVLVLDDDTYELIDTIAVGAGVFHQWVDGHQLWVVGDTSDSVTVVDADTRQVMASIDIPADIVDAGGFPHDVFVSGGHAFISILGLADGGMVLQYSTRTFEETGRVDTGGDPHLFVRAGRLYVASQQASDVTAYAARTLRPLGDVQIPAAHGIWVTRSGRVLVSNIAGGGIDAVTMIDRRLRHTIDAVSTDFATPHNLAVDRFERRLFITHSGAAADQVSIVVMNRFGFGSTETVTVGTNPFGLGLVD